MENQYKIPSNSVYDSITNGDLTDKYPKNLTEKFGKGVYSKLYDDNLFFQAAKKFRIDPNTIINYPLFLMNMYKDRDGNIIDVKEEQLELSEGVTSIDFGTPVFDFISLSAQIGGEQQICDLVGCIIRISKSKNTIKTNIAGYDGTVKEYVSSNDYQIDISGLVAGNRSNKYDNITMKQIIKLCEHTDVLTIYSKYLQDIYNIQKLWVDSWEMDQSESFSNIIILNIKGSSDNNINFSF